MHLFHTEMLRAHPPQRGSYSVGTYSAGALGRRPRFGCRSAGPTLHPLAAAIRSAVSPLPLSTLAPARATNAAAEPAAQAA
jgi:hypothetical protein